VYPKSGSFDKLILTYYTHTQFDDLSINKRCNLKAYNDVNKISEFLSYLKKFQLTEYRGKIPRETDDPYFIEISTTSGSYLGIIIENKDFIEFDIKTEDGNTISKKYKINDNNLDMKYIEDFYNNAELVR